MKLTGNADVRSVLIDGKLLDPKPSQAVWNHSPDGFNWGYGGSGPAQLALAILLFVGLDRDDAVRLHQQLKWTSWRASRRPNRSSATSTWMRGSRRIDEAQADARP